MSLLRSFANTSEGTDFFVIQTGATLAAGDFSLATGVVATAVPAGAVAGALLQDLGKVVTNGGRISRKVRLAGSAAAGVPTAHATPFFINVSPTGGATKFASLRLSVA